MTNTITAPATARGQLSGPLWRAARRLHIVGTALVIIAVIQACAGVIIAAALMSVWTNSARWVIGAGLLLGTGFGMCLVLAAAYAAQAYARSILEND